MSKLIKVELFRLQKTKSVWIILLVLIVACSISIFTEIYSSAENAFFNIQKDIMTIIMPCAIFCGLAFHSDFEERTIIHYIINGYKRSSIIISSFIRYILGSLIITILYPIICTYLAGIIIGFETSANEVIFNVLKITIMSLPLYIAIFSIFFTLMVLIRQSTITLGVSVALSIFIVVFTNRLYSSNQFTSVLSISPIIMISRLVNDFVYTDYIISLCVSILITACMLVLSIAIFKKADIR